MTSTSLSAGALDAPRITVPLVTFFVVSAAAAPLLALTQSATHLPPDALVLTQFSTLAGAAAVLGLSQARTTLAAPRPRRLGLALAAALALGLLYAGAVWAGAVLTSATTPHAVVLSTSLPLVVVLQLLGALGEEIGWRGVVQPLLEARMRLLPAATLTGLLFGAGHWFVLGAGLGTYVLFVSGSVLLSWGFAAVGVRMPWWRRTLTAGVVHWLANVSLLVLPLQQIEGVSPALAAGPLVVGLLSLPVLLRSGRR